MALPYHVKHRLVNRKMVLAAEVNSSNPEKYRAWVGVYPIREKDNFYNVLYFEVEHRYMDLDLDIAQDEMVNGETYEEIPFSDLEEVVSRWVSNLDDLIVPSLCDYPI